jgi:hypothetical protein
MRRRAALLGLDAPKPHAVAADMLIAQMVEKVAERSDLDPAMVVADATRILAEMRGSATVTDTPRR